MTIYVIAEVRKHEDYSGRIDEESVVEPSYGYFVSRQDAEAFVDVLDAPALADYYEKTKLYNAERDKYNKKQEEAKALGFAVGLPFPYPPDDPDLHTVIEIAEQVPA